MNLDRVPIDELRVDPVAAVCVLARYGGLVTVRQVTVRPKEGSSYKPAQPEGPMGDLTVFGKYAWHVPTETRYAIRVTDRDSVETEVMLSQDDLRAVARTIRGTFRVPK